MTDQPNTQKPANASQEVAPVEIEITGLVEMGYQAGTSVSAGSNYVALGESCVACGYPISLGGYHGLCCWCGG